PVNVELDGGPILFGQRHACLGDEVLCNLQGQLVGLENEILEPDPRPLGDGTVLEGESVTDVFRRRLHLSTGDIEVQLAPLVASTQPDEEALQTLLSV